MLTPLPQQPFQKDLSSFRASPCANRISPTFNEADFTKVWKSKESNLVVAVTAMGRPHVHKAVLRWDRRKKGGHSLK